MAHTYTKLLFYGGKHVGQYMHCVCGISPVQFWSLIVQVFSVKADKSA